MKVVAINGSPKTDGNTNFAIQTVFSQLAKRGIETEVIQVGNRVIAGCTGCNGCARNQNEKCVVAIDIVNDAIQIMKDADGILLASPVYFSDMSGTMKSFLERVFYVAGKNNGLFRHKVGASIVAVRRSGGIQTFDQLNKFLLYSEMFIPTGNYWSVIHGCVPGDAANDAEGIQTLEMLGQNYAYLLEVLAHSKGAVELPAPVAKVFTHLK